MIKIQCPECSSMVDYCPTRWIYCRFCDSYFENDDYDYYMK